MSDTPTLKLADVFRMLGETWYETEPEVPALLQLLIATRPRLQSCSAESGCDWMSTRS